MTKREALKELQRQETRYYATRDLRVRERASRAIADLKRRYGFR